MARLEAGPHALAQGVVGFTIQHPEPDERGEYDDERDRQEQHRDEHSQHTHYTSYAEHTNARTWQTSWSISTVKRKILRGIDE